jgi:flagellar biosynthesis/type III secretory pathway protein FliH
MMKYAEEALKYLSQDEMAQEAAWQRELELNSFQARLRQEHQEGLREGKLEGKQEGLREGKQEGLREGKQEGLREGMSASVEQLCNTFGVELSVARREWLRSRSAEELTALLAAIASTQSWPAEAGEA